MLCASGDCGDVDIVYANLYRKCAVNFMRDKMSRHHFIISTTMPTSMRLDGIDLVSTRLLSADDDSEGEDFDILEGEANALPALPARAYDETSVLCFKSLRGNPAAMKVLPHAPKIESACALVAVLEHTINDSEACGNKSTAADSYRVVQADTERDVAKRTILVAPNTFSYVELRNMKRATLSPHPDYDFGDAGVKCDAAVMKLVMHGLLHTLMIDGHDQTFYVIAPTTILHNEQFHILERLSKVLLVDLKRNDVANCESHWALTEKGRAHLRTFYRLENVESAMQPLPESVRILRVLMG